MFKLLFYSQFSFFLQNMSTLYSLYVQFILTLTSPHCAQHASSSFAFWIFCFATICSFLIHTTIQRKSETVDFCDYLFYLTSVSQRLPICCLLFHENCHRFRISSARKLPLRRRMRSDYTIFQLLLFLFRLRYLLFLNRLCSLQTTKFLT